MSFGNTTSFFNTKGWGIYHAVERNLDPKNSLLNGTRLVLRGLQQNFIDAEIITGSKKGERVFIPRLRLEPSESSLPFKMQRCQFPVILAFVLTINNALGQSFDFPTVASVWTWAIICCSNSM